MIEDYSIVVLVGMERERTSSEKTRAVKRLPRYQEQTSRDNHNQIIVQEFISRTHKVTVKERSSTRVLWSETRRGRGKERHAGERKMLIPNSSNKTASFTSSVLGTAIESKRALN